MPANKYDMVLSVLNFKLRIHNLRLTWGVEPPPRSLSRSDLFYSAVKEGQNEKTEEKRVKGNAFR